MGPEAVSREPAKVTDRESTGGALQEISFHLGRAYYSYVSFLEKVLREKGLDKHVRPGMGHILFALFEKDNVIIKDIAERVQLSPSTLTGMLKRMERTGIISRRRSQDDGRAVQVNLTALGRSLEPRCHDVVIVLNRVMTAGLEPGETETVKKALSAMTRAMLTFEEAVDGEKENQN